MARFCEAVDRPFGQAVERASEYPGQPSGVTVAGTRPIRDRVVGSLRRSWHRPRAVRGVGHSGGSRDRPLACEEPADQLGESAPIRDDLRPGRRLTVRIVPTTIVSVVYHDGPLSKGCSEGGERWSNESPACGSKNPERAAGEVDGGGARAFPCRQCPLAGLTRIEPSPARSPGLAAAETGVNGHDGPSGGPAIAGDLGDLRTQLRRDPGQYVAQVEWQPTLTGVNVPARRPPAGSARGCRYGTPQTRQWVSLSGSPALRERIHRCGRWPRLSIVDQQLAPSSVGPGDERFDPVDEVKSLLPHEVNPVRVPIASPTAPQGGSARLEIDHSISLGRLWRAWIVMRT